MKLELFESSEPINILPHDGAAIYFGKILSAEKTQNYYKYLLENLSWKNDEAIVFGKHIITKRKTAWYGDSDYDYTYSNITRKALKWTAELNELKSIIESLTKTTYNSCLANLYHNGDEGVSWHSDDEKTLSRHAAIASVSFGAERKFSFKHKVTKETISLNLESGSLLLMNGIIQSHWLHSLPKSKKILEPRINLTFRTIEF